MNFIIMSSFYLIYQLIQEIKITQNLGNVVPGEQLYDTTILIVIEVSLNRLS